MRKNRDDSDLPPEREKAQRARELDAFGGVGLKTAPARDAVDSEIQAHLRIIRSDQIALKTGKLSAMDRVALTKQIGVRLARIKELRQVNG